MKKKTLRIDFNGEGEVKAGDIITDGTVEVLNQIYILQLFQQVEDCRWK